MKQEKSNEEKIVDHLNTILDLHIEISTYKKIADLWKSLAQKYKKELGEKQ